jgi:hypothetical protein
MMAAQRETVGLAPAGRPPKSSFISIVSLVSESPLLLNAQSGPGWEVSNAPLARGYCPQSRARPRPLGFTPSPSGPGSQPAPWHSRRQLIPWGTSLTQQHFFQLCVEPDTEFPR